MLSATGASACGFRSPRFASGRRGRPGWRAASGQRQPGPRRGELGTGRGAAGDSTRLPPPPVALVVLLGSLCELHAWEAALHGGGTRTPAARAAPRGGDANAATFGAVHPSPCYTRADGSGRGRRLCTSAGRSGRDSGGCSSHLF